MVIVEVKKTKIMQKSKLEQASIRTNKGFLLDEIHVWGRVKLWPRVLREETVQT